ncbi:MAG TPA: 4-oxalocrotonate tautomerase DmpI [Armatimonadota bacterium]|nr:4-oxalocrotonate tautomerase DmpI [Armatimonadota bacterium]
MPIITLEGPFISKDQKAELAREFTATASRVIGLPPQAFVVVLKENNLENIASGGQLLSDREHAKA